jgi:hypothetical protein
MAVGIQRYIIVRGEGANQNYTTQFVMQLFSEEGKGEVDIYVIYIQSIFVVLVFNSNQCTWTCATGRITNTIRS